jgi:dihydrodipicolinate synthase/N-acetylneuraminate lyase
MLLQGIIPAITTPFYHDGKIYFRKLEQNVDRYSRTPVTGMVVLGSTGEPVMLGDNEKRDVLKSAMEAAAPHKVMIAGVGAESAIETVQMAQYAASLSYDVAMVRTPSYYKSQMKPENMLAYYRFVADHSPLPIAIYNFPPCTGYDIPVEVVAALAEHPNICGIKESSGSVEKVAALVSATKQITREATVTERFEAATARMLRHASSEKPSSELVSVGTLTSGLPGNANKPSSAAVEVVGTLRTRKKNVGFQVLVGTAQKLHKLLNVGAVGGILAFANCAPTACYEIYAAFKDRDEKLAEEKQQRIAAAATRVSGELGIPGLKYAMDLNGYYGGNARLPLLPLTADLKREIEQLMANIRN